MALPQNKLNALGLVYKAITRKASDLDEFKPFSIRIDNYYPSSSTLTGFEEQIGAVDNLVSFTFNATFPILLQTIVQSNIPSRLLGLIHLSTAFTKIRAHNWRLPSDIEVSITHANETRKGIEYTIETKVFQFKRLTITNTNIMLDKSTAQKRFTLPGVSQNNWLHLSTKSILSRDARKYALHSKDFNPIHMSNWLAKQFGLPHMLIHGMYNVHWMLTEISSNKEFLNHPEWDTLKVNFNKPCYLPATVELKQDPNCDSFGLFSLDGQSRYVIMTLS